MLSRADVLPLPLSYPHSNLKGHTVPALLWLMSLNLPGRVKGHACCSVLFISFSGSDLGKHCNKSTRHAPTGEVGGQPGSGPLPPVLLPISYSPKTHSVLYQQAEQAAPQQLNAQKGGVFEGGVCAILRHTD